METSQKTRKLLAAALRRGMPKGRDYTEYREFHEKLAQQLLAGESFTTLLNSNGMDDWPSTYAWLKAELKHQGIEF